MIKINSWREGIINSVNFINKLKENLKICLIINDDGEEYTYKNVKFRMYYRNDLIFDNVPLEILDEKNNFINERKFFIQEVTKAIKDLKLIEKKGLIINNIHLIESIDDKKQYRLTASYILSKDKKIDYLIKRSDSSYQWIYINLINLIKEEIPLIKKELNRR